MKMEKKLAYLNQQVLNYQLMVLQLKIMVTKLQLRTEVDLDDLGLAIANISEYIIGLFGVFLGFHLSSAL